ncbi:putative transcription activator [Clavispora lusitaniae]|uniref:Transcription activator n=1 Tax=Clavispora lusitaniae TaxID=36911 RepID=A0ACD0WP76_CLALS|nr:putative transcription activator [Clavispora lusitaniae]QFZ34591.1 putative transcription activator [Clavispora lusitaniae]QFZ40276.1 putative transcription activator [Clavispora lusitaniae]QFZ45956.1 putative transcription activator [Clavispora lusitaniae]QFZ51618.1 putative transcription activator [Clavispora lusitaniae]
MSSEMSATSVMKKLPMIVDIAIDTNGKTMYQVHETSKLVRREMPKSANFSETSLDTLELYDEPKSFSERTGSLSPSMDTKEKLATSRSFLDPSSKFGNHESFGEMSKDHMGTSSTPLSTSSCPTGDDNIWGRDVQEAFEEVLAIVPKNGLNKIKIGGRSCGRNELISDYILAKTGKFRSRKQVSSHIQVIKNMGVKTSLIKLINDGPTFDTPEEAERNSHLFEEIFTKINLNKSLGVNSIYTSTAKGGGPIRRHSSANISSVQRRRKSHNSFMSVKNICFSLESMTAGVGPTYLSVQEDCQVKTLTIKENAAISNRFPGLEDFANLPVPVFHNMVRIFNPFLKPDDYSIDNGLRTSYMLEYSSPNSNLSSFTTVYSFGNEVLKVNEDDFQVNTTQPFLLKFWKCFFLQLLQQPTCSDAAFKGVTVKQVIYNSSEAPMSAIPKHKIKAVLLWEFSRVDEITQAVSSTARILLPQSLSNVTGGPDNHNKFGAGPQTYQTYNVHRPSHVVHEYPLYQVPPNQPEVDLAHMNNPNYGGVRQLPVNVPYAQFANPIYHPSANVDLTSVRSNPEDAPFAGQYY